VEQELETNSAAAAAWFLILKTGGKLACRFSFGRDDKRSPKEAVVEGLTIPEPGELLTCNSSSNMKSLLTEPVCFPTIHTKQRFSSRAVLQVSLSGQHDFWKAIILIHEDSEASS
jgi:hypothetical protein